MRKPNLIIAGCQKCGTTWLHSSLKISRHVFGSKAKELNFFNQARYYAEADGYLLNFPEEQGVKYYMESTPHYFQRPAGRVDIASNIHEFLDDPTIIVVFRNPIMRYQSAYIHHIMQGRFPYTEIIDEFTNDQKLLTFGTYADTLQHWRAIFPDIGVFFYDDLVADRFEFFESVMRFLGLTNDINRQRLNFRSNDKNIKARKFGDEWPSMPRLSDRLCDRLIAHYTQDVNRLQEMTGRNLQHWLHPAGWDQTQPLTSREKA